jgi:hypothetical protein
MRRIILVLALCCNGLCVMAAQATDSLQSRVSIEYRDASAVDVINALAAAAGLTAEFSAGQLRPVTVTLTNVRLSTALTAVCENASCVWQLQGVLKVSPVATTKRFSLPPMVSFEVYDVSPREVFRALAAALDVPLSVEVGLSNEPASFRLRNAAPADALNTLCGMAHCQWRFDPDRGLRLIATP